MINKSILSRGIIITLILIVLIWAVLFRFISDSYESYKKTFTLSEAETLESVIEGTTRTYESFSQYIFNQLLTKPEVLELVAQAADADAEQKDALRGRLYELLKDDYDSLSRYSFQQLQFHFPDGENFLRFNEPERYGDNVFKAKETVRIASTTKHYVYGFEAGGTFNGIRFVYPLFYNQKHIGSVELAVPLQASIDTLLSLYDDITVFYILDKELIDRTVPPEYLNNYAGSLISRDYMVETNVYYKILNNDAFLPSDNGTFINKIQENVKDRLGDNEIVCFYFPFEGRNYTVHFLPIENVSQELAGYFVSIHEDNHIEAIDQQRSITVILLTVMAVMVFVFTIIFMRDKHKIYKMAMKDSLTNISGKREFFVVAKKAFSSSKRYGMNLCMFMIDIDHFKKVNDTYGHQVGDSVLKSLVAIISQTLRQSDFIARWGGEEFVVLLENTDIYTGCQIAERIRLAVDQHDFKDVGHVTISIGVAVLIEADKMIDSIIGRADEALYKAKKEGRNRISISEDNKQA